MGLLHSPKNAGQGDGWETQPLPRLRLPELPDLKLPDLSALTGEALASLPPELAGPIAAALPQVLAGIEKPLADVQGQLDRINSLKSKALAQAEDLNTRITQAETARDTLLGIPGAGAAGVLPGLSGLLGLAQSLGGGQAQALASLQAQLQDAQALIAGLTAGYDRAVAARDALLDGFNQIQALIGELNGD